MTAKLFEAALGVAAPWYVKTVDFDRTKKTLTIAIDFIAGHRFAVPGVDGYTLRTIPWPNSIGT